MYLLLVDRYVHRHGWTQGRLWAPDGAVCVLGAQLAVVAAGYGTPTTAWRARIRLGNALDQRGEPVPVDDWNDGPAGASMKSTDCCRPPRLAPDVGNTATRGGPTGYRSFSRRNVGVISTVATWLHLIRPG
ncbi:MULTISPECIES: hypothetical protein [unclassified Kitasatospora]|uniref:DUF6197 family protein n=1 Tax=unclassified Kitasatospora TaxID=2633591 RepID=UPI0012FA2971|nr:MULTISPECIES: hypothetical protein [unclassified Kitasatospora]